MKRFWALVICLVLLHGIPGGRASAAGIRVRKIRLNETALTLTITAENPNPTFKLKATVSPKDATNRDISWKSSDKTVAKVNSKGLVTALAAGKVTITCKAKDGSGAKATCEITVRKKAASNELDKAAPKKIRITGSKYVARGKKITLKATVTPAKASQKVTWTTSDRKIATVNSKGVVKGVKPGKVKITATSKANKKISKTFTIEVKEKAVKSIRITGKKDLDLAGTKTVTLKAKATPKQAAQSFEWKSSDSKVATVSAKGKVTAKGVGTVKITCTATDGSRKKKTVTIKVTNSAAVEPDVPGDILEAVGALNHLISTYDGNITPVAGYEEYSLARLLVQTSAPLPDTSAWRPVKIIQDSSDHYIIQFDSPVNAKNCADFLKTQQGVSYVVPDEKITVDVTSGIPSASGNSSKSSPSWGVSHIHADEYAQNLQYRKVATSLTVAVIDSGISTSHSLFSGRNILPGKDFVDNDQTPQDESGHGTHVAGIIMDCTKGLNISILPIRVVAGKRDGTTDKAWWRLACHYVADEFIKGRINARVINMSLGCDRDSDIDEGVTYAVQSGILVVVSAGNDRKNVSGRSPAGVSIRGCIAVSAINSKNEIWRSGSDGSNYGETVDLCAPGDQIVSAGRDGGNLTKSGTSMAAPHVAAAAAMLICDYPKLSPARIEALLEEKATDLGNRGKDNEFGYGLVNLSGFIDTNVEISKKTFPDEQFRNYIKAQFDKNGDGKLSETERNSVTGMNCESKSVHNLTGIEYFPNLSELYCGKNEIDKIDLSRNTKLTILECSESKIENLDLSRNTALTTLMCQKNWLRKLDLTNNTELLDLRCEDNWLTALDVTKNTKLRSLVCSKNELGTLDLSKNTVLRSLVCAEDQLTSLSVTANTGLEELFCDSNSLQSLDVTKNTKLYALSCYGNQLTSLNVSQNTLLEQLICYGNQFTGLNVTNCTVLADLVRNFTRQRYPDWDYWNDPDHSFYMLEVDHSVTVTAGSTVSNPQ